MSSKNKRSSTFCSWSRKCKVSITLFDLCLALAALSSSGLKAKASVVKMLHLCPVGDPVLFLRLLGTKSQIELIALGSADLHRPMLWHYPVVEGSLEEPKLPRRQRECDITGEENQQKERWNSQEI